MSRAWKCLYVVVVVVGSVGCCRHWIGCATSEGRSSRPLQSETSPSKAFSNAFTLCKLCQVISCSSTRLGTAVCVPIALALLHESRGIKWELAIRESFIRLPAIVLFFRSRLCQIIVTSAVCSEALCMIVSAAQMLNIPCLLAGRSFLLGSSLMLCLRRPTRSAPGLLCYPSVTSSHRRQDL